MCPVLLLTGYSHHLQRRSEFCKLISPIEHKGRRRNDYRRSTSSLLLSRHKHRYGLKGLSKSHIISQDTTKAVSLKCPYPTETCFLVPSERGTDSLGYIIIRVINCLHVLHYLAEYLIPCVVDLLMFLKHLVKIQCTVHRKVHFPLHKILR